MTSQTVGHALVAWSVMNGALSHHTSFVVVDTFAGKVPTVQHQTLGRRQTFVLLVSTVRKVLCIVQWHFYNNWNLEAG